MTGPAELAVLIVEDEPIIAMELEDALAEAGFDVLGIAPSVAEARRRLAGARPDCVVLDMHLRGETTFALADELAAEGVARLFVSGNEASALPAHLRDATLLPKPVRMDRLARAIAAEVGRAA